MKKRLFPFLLVVSLTAFAKENISNRYFYSGNEHLAVKGGEKKLNGLSPRLVALLGYLQKQMGGKRALITILSGYRSPAHNEALRRQGKLAGKASLHLEGMAADFTMNGVEAKKIWEVVRSMDCCGVGYYHGNAVHVDTGPSRFWDETSSKVFTDISLHNKQIYPVTEYDIYHPGETLHVRLVRMTEYPFGIKNEKGDCILIHNREEAQNFSFALPSPSAPNEKLKIKISFCEKPSKEMPDEVFSNAFIVAAP